MIVLPGELWTSQAKPLASTSIPAGDDSFASTTEESRCRPGPLSSATWKPAAAGTLLILAASLGTFGWCEMNPTALADANEAYRKDDLESALRLSVGHLERRPGSRQAALIAARCLSRLGKPQEATAYFDAAAPIDQADSHIRALAWVVNNARNAAIQSYREMLVRWPDDVLALSRLGAVLISESRWTEALATAKSLIQIPDGAVIGHTLAGVVHSNTGEPEECVAELSKVLELDPELRRMPLKPRPMFWTEFAKNLLIAGRAEEAQRHLHRALREGDDARVADLLGQAYFLQGMLDDAERCWRLTLQWDPDRFGTWARLGKLELQRRRPARAIEPLRRSIELQPEAVGPIYCLSVACRLLGRIEESESLRQRADGLRAKAVDRGPRDKEDVLTGSGSASGAGVPDSWRPSGSPRGLPESL